MGEVGRDRRGFGERKEGRPPVKGTDDWLGGGRKGGQQGRKRKGEESTVRGGRWEMWENGREKRESGEWGLGWRRGGLGSEGGEKQWATGRWEGSDEVKKVDRDGVEE